MKRISTYALIFVIICAGLCKAYQLIKNNEGTQSSPCMELQINEKCEGFSSDISYLAKFSHSQSSFVTSLKNIGSNKVSAIYIRIFLSDGKMLGPKKIVDLLPNDEEKVIIKCEKSVFSWWSFHITSQEGQNEKMVRQNDQKPEEDNLEEWNVENNTEVKFDDAAEPNTVNILEAEPVTESIHKGEQTNTEIKNAEKSDADVKDAVKSDDDIKNAEKSDEDIENAKKIK